MSEAELEAALFPTDPKPPRAPARYLPDFSHIHKELQEHKHVTLQLLWGEYTATHPDGYRYSQFCHHYQQWKRQRDVVMRQEHRPGEKLFVDWAGDKTSVHEPDRGTVLQASVFVAVLGASSYTYAEATADETMPNWIGAHVRAFEFMGGVAELLIPGTSSQVPQCSSGVAAVADDPVGTNGRRTHRASGNPNHGNLSSSGNGLSLLPGHHPLRTK